jgi:hypothetical protein
VTPSDDEQEAIESSRARRELERRAFARPADDAEQQAALEAQAQLRRLAERAAESAKASRPTAVETDPQPSHEESASDPPQATPARRKSRIRKRLLATVIVIVATAGVLVGRYVLPVDPSDLTSTPATQSSELVLPADVSRSASTRRWFLHSQTASDKVPLLPVRSQSARFSSESTRLVYVEQDGARVWVALSKNPSDSYCLIYESSGASDRTGTVALQCTAFDKFARDGVSILVPGTAIYWDSQAISVTEG